MSNRQVIPLRSYHLPIQRSTIAPESFNFSKQKRRRGIVLTQQGWQKLHQSQVLYNEIGERHTLEYLSEQTLLDPRTICRITGREVAVDKRSLMIFFAAFNLELSQEDYTTPQSDRQKTQTECQTTSLTSPTVMDDEVARLKRQMIESCHGLIQFLNLDRSHSITLSVKFAPQSPPQLNLTL